MLRLKKINLFIVSILGVLFFAPFCFAQTITEINTSDDIKAISDKILFSEEISNPIFDKDRKQIGTQALVQLIYLGNEIDASNIIFTPDSDYSNTEKISDNILKISSRPKYYKNINGQVQEVYYSQVLKSEFDKSELQTTVEKIISLFKTPYVLADTFYVGAGDGYINNGAGSTNWDTERDSPASKNAFYTNNIIEIEADCQGSTYSIVRGYLPFDTSAITADYSVASGTLYILRNGGNSIIGNLSAGNQADAGKVETTDWGLVEDTKFSNDTTFSANVLYALLLNSNGRTFINTTGYSKFGLRGTADIDDTAPSCTGAKYADFDSSETANDPYLILELEASDEPEEPTATSTASFVSCDNMSYNQKCVITGYEYASGTLATTTAVTTYNFMNILVMVGELLLGFYIVLGLIKYKAS